MRKEVDKKNERQRKVDGKVRVKVNRKKDKRPIDKIEDMQKDRNLEK